MQIQQFVTEQKLPNTSQIWAYSTGYADIWIYVLDKAIQADQKQSIKYFINIDTHVPITQQFGGSAVIEFSVYNIETDTNIWPWKQT